MKKFLAVYTGSPKANAKTEWDAMDPDKRAALEQSGMKAWGDWMTANGDVIAETGGPLGKTKRVAADGVTDIKNEMVGYVVIEAASHEEAAKKFENHPHFAIFPGEAVEIMECLPMPGA